MLDNILTDSLAQLCAEHITTQQVREVEKTKDIKNIWSILNESGFCDALVEEEYGGAGLGLSGAFPLIFGCGKFLIPTPLSYTMAIRAFLASESAVIPKGPITLAIASPASDGIAVQCHDVLYGEVAEWALVQEDDRVLLLPIKAEQRTSTGVYSSLNANLCWATIPDDTLQFDRKHDWSEIGSCLLAAQIAGAADTIFNMTLNYAGERNQFGRAIGKFQAIQQQISVMAEHTAATRVATQIGFASNNWYPQSLSAAIAKSRCSDAVPTITSIAHAVHGAIGITSEYDLQLFTRRLHDWRFSLGSESYWNSRVGSALLGTDKPVVDFIRTSIDINI